MLCGLFMLAAFIAFVKGRYALFCLAATIALLLKETALTVPIAALVLAGASFSTDRRRTVKNLIWLALPLLIWGAGRTFIFEYGRDIYVLSSTSQWGWLLKPVRNLLYLRSTLYRGPLRATEDAIQRTLSADSIRNYELVKRSGKLLTELLGNMPADVTTVFLLDDVVMQGTAPGYFAKWAGFRGRIVVLNSVTPILGCHATPAGQSRYTLLRSASATELEYTAPDCFYALNEAPLSMFDVHNDVKRGPWMTYHFAQMQLTNPISTLSASDYDVGSHWTLTVSDPSCAVAGTCVWLGLDPARQVYYALN
jgi:hypothetical protein